MPASQLRAVTIATPRSAYENGHKLAVGCSNHEPHRWRVFTLDELERSGVADRAIETLSFTCSQCGEPADKQLRPPPYRRT